MTLQVPMDVVIPDNAGFPIYQAHTGQVPRWPLHECTKTRMISSFLSPVPRRGGRSDLLSPLMDHV
jgi:hypothetical protein